MKRGSFSIGLGLAAAALSAVALAVPANASVPANVPVPGGGVAHSSALAAAPGGIVSPSPLPPQFSAPYVDVTEVGNLAALSNQSGSKYLSLAFLQTDAPGSCIVYWAGNTAMPISSASYGDQINAIRRAGGDVIPSFGGYAADTTNTEIADSCTDVHKIALAYENVITTYKVQRLDFDIEVDSLSNLAGIDRRNKAIVELQNWATQQHRNVSIAYTLPSTPNGLAPTGLAVLQSAAAHHARIDAVNVMTFDYWDGLTHNMVTDAEHAAAGLVSQLHQTIDPTSPQQQLWRKVGIIQMNGIDDFGPEETLTVPQAAQFIAWASHAHVNMVSFWALQRDNGNCPGTVGSNTCSGVVQGPWAFSHAFAKIQHGSR
ncbi:MAG TPA: chitinase [Microbacteriaceae bacterium]